MQTETKKILLIIFSVLIGLVLLIVGILYGARYFSNKKESLPESFSTTRIRAGELSNSIVALSNDVNEKIKILSALDPVNEKYKAEAIINDARAKNQEAYQKSLSLSDMLQQIAEAFKKVRSSDYQRIMYDALATEISLINEFIQYTKEFNNFLDSLSNFFQNPSSENKFKVQSTQQAVNEHIGKVNLLNEKFNSLMRDFENISK